jgi:hypothetical protein
MARIEKEPTLRIAVSGKTDHSHPAHDILIKGAYNIPYRHQAACFMRNRGHHLTASEMYSGKGKEICVNHF